eukprot:8031428-Pyramimonas_sp.AAC.1
MFMKGRLKAKAAESRHLLPLLPMVCRENAALLADKAFLLTEACDALNDCHDIMYRERRQMSAEA